MKIYIAGDTVACRSAASCLKGVVVRCLGQLEVELLLSLLSGRPFGVKRGWRVGQKAPLMGAAQRFCWSTSVSLLADHLARHGGGQGGTEIGERMPSGTRHFIAQPPLATVKRPEAQ